MEAIIPIAILVIIFAAIGLAAWMHSVNEKKRVSRLEEVAQELGLEFYPTGLTELLERLASFSLFNQGYDRQIKNLIQGETGEVNLALFDYQYTTGSGKEKSTHRATVATISSTNLNCPDFLIRPENFFDRIGSMIGFQDIDFDSHPAFSKLFVLQGSNEESIREFMRPEILNYFENHPGISVEGNGGMLIFYRGRTRVKPDQWKEHFAQAYEVFGVIVDNS